VKQIQNRQKFQVKARVQKPREVINLKKLNRSPVKKRIVRVKDVNN
jgi:hypothetical protein